jgi:hypothetical protein
MAAISVTAGFFQGGNGADERITIFWPVSLSYSKKAKKSTFDSVIESEVTDRT